MTCSTETAASPLMRNTRPRTSWNELPGTVRRAIESATGSPSAVEPISAGLNCAIAAVLHTPTGRVFIKGLPHDHPRVATQRREAEINPYVAPIAPRLLCQVDRDGWNILAFEHLQSRHANLAPDSPDLPKIADTLTRLGQIPAPQLPLRRLEDRWAGLADDSALTLLAGEQLLHTDLNPHNILIGPHARIVDWAWPTLGAAWIDPACAALWLIAQGHNPQAAESWAQQIPSFPPHRARESMPSPPSAADCGNRSPTTTHNPGNSGLHAAAQAWAGHRITATSTA